MTKICPKQVYKTYIRRIDGIQVCHKPWRFTKKQLAGVIQ